MTDPSTPVPSDEAVEAVDLLRAAAIMVGTLLDAAPAPQRDWLAGAVTRQGQAFPGAERLQRASELILREVDEPRSVAIDAPRIAAEAAAEARAATLREVIEMFQTLQPWERNTSGTFTGAEATALVKRMFNPEANE